MREAAEPVGRLIRRARRAQGKSQARLAELLCEASGDPTVTRHEVSRWERGVRVPGRWLPWLAVVLGVPREDLEAAAAVARWQGPGRDVPAQRGDDGRVNRRSFVVGSLGAAASWPLSPADLLADGPPDPLAAIRAELAHCAPEAEPLPAADLAHAAGAAKRQVQDCRYAAVLPVLPGLLAAARASQARHDDPATAHAAATLYHAASSLLLKHGDASSAWIAADRAVTAARTTGDPAAAGGAARILVHALARVGHHDQAVALAAHSADRLAPHVRAAAPEVVAVFGALLLRGATAAAKAGDRATAAALLDDADRAAVLLGVDGNRRWTAFGPTNVAVHRSSVALALGDAGAALDAARGVDVERLEVAERRAVFWLDVARALHACGRAEKAGAALLTAERHAPEEIRSRAVARSLVGELAARDGSGDVRSLADRAGVRW